MKKYYIIGVIIALFIAGFTIALINEQNNDRALEESKLQIERDKISYQKEQDLKAEALKAYNENMLNACLSDAEENYWNYAELNGEGTREDGITMSNRLWDTAAETKQNDMDNCYRKYNK